VLDLAHATRTYKTFLTGGHFDMKSKTVEVVDAQLGEDFANAVWAAITSDEAGGADNAVKLAQGGAAFVMVELVEALRKAGESAAVKKVLGSVKVRKAIETSGKKGATLLADKLASL
jgi:pumilio family protein 6